MYEDLTYQINGCLFKVYNTLGNIWKEDVYEHALELELKDQGLLAERQKEFDVSYLSWRVGRYRLDLVVEDRVIVELKALPEIFPLHRAQLISYLKGYNKPVGILANFGGTSLQHQTFPNLLHRQHPLEDRFDYNKLTLPEKGKIRELLLMANRILVTLGAGYLPQIYRRAFYYELKSAGVDFGIVKEVAAHYHNTVLETTEVNFFQLGDLLLSVVAVNTLDHLFLLKFRNYVKHLDCRRGLVFNFNSITLDFRYFEL